LRQGDPLSPLLIVVVMEALNKMLTATVGGGLLSSFPVETRHSNVVNISHMLFANDTLVFCGADPNHLHYLRALFLCFEVVSGSKVNLAKSILVPTGNVDGLAGILGCGVSSLPLKYLRLLLGTC
jgi:hypothetical protein